MVALRSFILLCCVCLLILSACQAAAPDSAAPIATSAPRAQAGDLESASAVAAAFLEAWQRSDYAAMHSLLTFRNRELTSFAEFRALYERASDTMSLVSLDYRPMSLTGRGAVLSYQYEMSFKSRILGQFSDSQRQLQLVIDPKADAWRIAWSPADIFAEMGKGARLVFEEQVPSRANIYDRHGRVIADQNGRVVRVMVDNRRIPDRENCFGSLAAALDKSLEFFRDLFDRRSGADWIVDAGILEASAYIETGDRLQADCDADFRQQATRRYSNGGLLPHVVGHVGYPDADQLESLAAVGFNAETIIGKAGIEASMNDTLAGQPGGRLSLLGADGRRIRILSEARSRIPESLWLSIDLDLQAAVIRLLKEASERGSWAEDSPGAAIAIMDLRNGEILALVSHPSYDANILNPFPSMGRQAAAAAHEELVADEALPMLNRVTQGAYPTGSVMKGLTALAALESGVYNEDSRYYCTGSWAYGADRRVDWLLSGHGSMTSQTALTNSCNPFFYEAGFRLNARDPWLLPTYAQKLGLGQSSGLTQIPEVTGLAPTPDNITRYTGLPWSYAHAVNFSIGQGEVLATPLQMLRLYAAIANGGYLLRPHLVRERGILEQRTLVAQRDVMRDAELNADNLAIIRRGLCDVISGYTGTASHIFRGSPLHDVGVCGKTGTAQAPGDGKRPHSWFIAFAPAKQPQIGIVTMIENAGEGSAVAAPLTRAILEYYYFELP